MTKYHRLGDLTTALHLLTVLEAGKSKNKVSVGLVSGTVSLPGLQMATFSQRLHMASYLCVHGERERERERDTKRD